MKSILLLAFSLLSLQMAFPQKEVPLDSLLQSAFNSKDSSNYYFKKSWAQLKTKADTANYLFYRFYKWDRDMEADSSRIVLSQLEHLLKSLDSLERLRSVYERLHFQELRTGRYEQALDWVQKAITTAEKMQDTAKISLHYSDKSVIYHDFEDYAQGVEYGKMAYNIMDQAQNKKYRYLIYANNATAINFDDWGKADSALYYHYRNVELLKKADDTLRFAFIFNNIGNTLLKQKKFEEAEKYIKRALKINLARDVAYNLATNYTNLATISYELSKNGEAKNYFLKANEYANKSESIEKIRDVVQQEAWFYKKIGDYKNALEKQEAFYVLRDSVFNKERAARVAEMETKYETEKKERDLAETRASLAEKELEVVRKNRMLYGSIGVVLTLVLLGYLIYSQQRLKNKQLKKEAELKEALARIETQNKLQEQRLRISRDLHDNIGSQLTFITSSLDTLKYRLEDSDKEVGDKLDAISSFTTQTIYELRDTIWAMNKESISVDDLKGRILNFLDKAGESKEGIDFTFQHSDSITDDHTLPSVYGMNVYRIIQEAVNNALKYAKPSAIRVDLAREGTLYRLLIEDNGQGFIEGEIEPGNGLNNIRKRAKELKGHAEIVSEPEKGTRVIVEFKSV